MYKLPETSVAIIIMLHDWFGLFVKAIASPEQLIMRIPWHKEWYCVFTFSQL